jgi:Ras-related C3 botulinum toxin substrate 1
MSTSNDIERTKKREPGKITRAIKVALVGDGTVGKTCLLMSYICQGFLEDYVPTMFDNFSAIEEVDGELVNVILWDTAGQEDYENIRITTCFPNTHIFILCFSVVHPDSFHNIKQKWLDEIKKSCPDTPYILVGTKTDLREDPETVKKLLEKKKEPISSKIGKKRAKEIKAKHYCECSAKDINSVNEVFKTAIKIVMDPLKEKKKEVAKLAKKEEELERKMEKKVEKLRKKFEKEESKNSTPSNNNNTEKK